jgi:zinc transport system substrate-binding protein
MKNYLLFLIIFLFVWGCRPQRNKQEDKPVVLVSILPEKTFVEKISDVDFRVEVLIPQGANPATYSLLPDQMKAISEAKTWFRMGYVGFELSWGERIGQVNPAMNIVDLSEGLELVTGEISGNPFMKPGVDPHTWLSPANVRIISRHILDELKLINPGKAEVYQENWVAFQKEIEQTELEIKEILWKTEGKKFITYHPSLTYFARDYGLTQLSIEQGGKEPTPARMAQLAETAKSEGLQAIFIQSDFDRELATVFAEEIKGKIIQIWPLNPAWSSNLKEIARMIKSN